MSQPPRQNTSSQAQYDPPNKEQLDSAYATVHPPMAKHTFATRFFHHVTLILLVILWALAEVFDNIGAHKALGVVFLLWVVGRLVNAAMRPKMSKHSAAKAPVWQTAAAHLVHCLLYVCMLAMPIVGVLMSVYGGRAVNVFGLFSIPVFVTPDREMSGFYHNLHTDVIFPLLLILIALHVVAVLYHQLVLKDGLLRKMI